MRKLFCAMLAICAVAAFAQSRSHVPGRLLVGFKAGVPPSQIDAVVHGLRGSHKPIPGTNVKIVSLPANADENAVINAFKNRPEVDFAEFDEIVPVSTTVTPNDPGY